MGVCMDSLLPPNSSPLERKLAKVGARISDLPVPIKTLWNPWTCPAHLLPWLAWSLGVETWPTYWTEQQRRQAIADSLQVKRLKGTVAAVRQVIAAMGAGNRFVWGYDAVNNRFIDPTPTSVHDVMSYCAGNWFSDYNYRKMQVHLTPADRTATAEAERVFASSAAVEQDLLLVSGEIRNGVLRLNPLKVGIGLPRLPATGPYLLRITTRSGAVIEQRFDSREIDHQPELQRFGFTLAHPGPIERVEVLRDGRVLAQRASRERALSAGTASSAPATVQASEQRSVLTLHWDAAQHPYLTVTHVGSSRTVLAMDLQGGAATLPTAALPAGGHFELSLSDGLNSQRILLTR